MRFLYLVPILVVAVFGAIFFAGLKNNSGNEIPSTLIDQAMPSLPETGLEGFETGDLDMIIRDHPMTLVNYWASWCAPCRAEHPQLIALADMGVPIIGVNYKDKADNAAGFLDELGNPYTAIRIDKSGRVAIDWGVSGVPETFFVDRDGKVIKRFFGPITKSALENEILPLVNAGN